jgi:hypothetical protein
MASTYVNDLRLNEMATGDQSGSWGTVTNTNLELIAEAFSFGTEGITTNADTHTTTIADGATDPGRSMFLKYTGTLDSACTITIAPNTISKLWFIENGTSGSQNIIISQGSGANITIPPGDTKAIYSDGAGSGAAMVDAFASLSVVDLKVQDDLTVTDDASVGGDLLVSGEVQTANIGFTDGDNAMVIADGGAVTFPIASVFTSGFQSNGAINVGVDDTGYDVKFFGDTASAFMLWDASADDLILGGAAGLSVNSAALVTGVLTTTAATVFNGGFASNALSTINTSSSGVQPLLTLSQADNTSGNTWGIDFKRTTGSASGDLVAKIHANREGGDATGITFGINKADGSLIEAGRFDSSGNLLVGKTASSLANDGFQAHNSGYIGSTNSGASTAYFNRKTDDGDIINFQKDGSAVGSIGTTGGKLFIGSPDGSDAFLRFESNEISPCTSTGAFRSGAISLGKSDSQFKDFYLSGGVYLGGTAAANKFEDYEEGTWTPTLLGATTNPTQSYVNQTAYYTKVGTVVHITGWIYFANSGITTGAGALTLAGLPFTIAAVLNARGAMNIAEQQSFNTAGAGAPTTGFLVFNSTTIALQVYQNSAGKVSGTTSALASDVQNATRMAFTCTFNTAA